MDTPKCYEIQLQGHLGPGWSDWFAGLEIQVEANGMTMLRGHLSDQAALLGILTKIHALNLYLVSFAISNSKQAE
jgi:hypothetical protein